MEDKVLALVAEKVANKVVKKINTTKPAYFKNHEKSDNEQFGAIRKTLEGQNKAMKEIKEGNDIFHEKSAPMLEWFEEMNYAKKYRISLMKATSFWSAFLVGLAAVF